MYIIVAYSTFSTLHLYCKIDIHKNTRKMPITIIKASFIRRIKEDDSLKLKLAQASDVRITSVDRWLRYPSIMLTTFDNLEILKAHFKISDIRELLEQEPAQA
jgi:hypothetical protein